MGGRSPSTRRAWIEICISIFALIPAFVALHPEGVDRNGPCGTGWKYKIVALHPEGVDRNGKGYETQSDCSKSPSTRRAWIEIYAATSAAACSRRSPSTRRAWIEMGGDKSREAVSNVALHPEGVDRNSASCAISPMRSNVALHPEGVDRNELLEAEFGVQGCRPPPGGRG